MFSSHLSLSFESVKVGKNCGSWKLVPRFFSVRRHFPSRRRSAKNRASPASEKVLTKPSCCVNKTNALFFSRENDAFARAGRRVVARHRGVSLFLSDCRIRGRVCLLNQDMCPEKQETVCLFRKRSVRLLGKTGCFVPAECCGKMDFYSHSLTYK